MPEIRINLSFLITRALNDFAHVERLQLLLKIGLDETDQPSDEAYERLALLVDTYSAQVEPWIEEVRFGLERIGRQVLPRNEAMGEEKP